MVSLLSRRWSRFSGKNFGAKFACVLGHRTSEVNIRTFCFFHQKYSKKTIMAPPAGETSSQSPERKQAKLDIVEISDRPVLQFAKLSEHALTPTRGSKQAAGFDLYSAYDYAVPAKGKVLAKTDIQIALPDGCYGRVAPRSGLAVKHFIDVGAGVIDQDYRGNVGVVLFNFGEEEFKVQKGDRIAQLVLERIFIPDLQELNSLEETNRGAGGFGSTGTN